MSTQLPPATGPVNPAVEAFIARACSDGWIDLGEILPFAEAMRKAFPPTDPAEPPPKCNEAIYQSSKVVAILDGGMFAVEGLVKEANRHGPEMDWHYFAGRAVVKTLGDPIQAHDALIRAIPRVLSGNAS